MHTADTLLHFMLAGDMILTGFPGIGVGSAIGDVEQDREGVERMMVIGKNMAWLLKVVEQAQRSG